MGDKQKPIKGQSHWCEGRTTGLRPCRQVVLNTSDHCESGHYNPIRTVPMVDPKKTVRNTSVRGPGFSFEVEEISEPPTCDVCGAVLQLTVDMGRVQAGIGGPRPTYICPDWKFHGQDDKGEAIERGERAKNAKVSETINAFRSMMSALDSYEPAEHIIGKEYVDDPELRLKLQSGAIKDQATVRGIAIHLLDQREALRRAYASEGQELDVIAAALDLIAGAGVTFEDARVDYVEASAHTWRPRTPTLCARQSGYCPRR